MVFSVLGSFCFCVLCIVLFVLGSLLILWLSWIWVFSVYIISVVVAVLSVVLRRALRRIRSVGAGDLVELRGWMWDDPPVKPRAYLGLGVSEVAYGYCESFRDLWFRRRGVRGRVSSVIEVGRIVHEVFHRVASDLRMLLGRGVRVWDAYSRVYWMASRYGWPR